MLYLSVKKFTEYQMNTNISLSALIRLCTLHSLLDELSLSGRESISSAELAEIIGISAHTIRKDINFLGEIGNSGAGYKIKKLYVHIDNELRLNKSRNACVVGLGRIGSAILSYERFNESGFTIVAGFDSDINLLDTIQTDVPVFPTYEIPEIVKQKNIELSVLAVPADAARDIADRLILAGVKGVVNFSPAIFTCDDSRVHIKNMDLINEFNVLSACISLDEQKLVDCMKQFELENK